MTTDHGTPDADLVSVIRDPLFVQGWERYTAAVTVNAGEWPRPVAAARTVAAATGAWSGSPGSWSENAWDAVLRQEFPTYFGLPPDDGSRT